MTPKAQRIVIAEECGWKEIRSLDWIPLGIPPTRRNGFEYIPDYPGCLNAMHEAIESLSYQDQVEWVYKLGEVLGFRNRNDWTEISMIQATAAQRAEAFLRTIGKWEGDVE